MNYGMKEAVKYFEDMGLPIKNGLIDSENLSEEQVKLLEKWEKNTQIEGIMMPQVEDFYKAVLVAVSLNPQRNEDGGIKYLFGKGIGVEIALRGNVKGRNGYETNPIYRSHSDFELYDAKENRYTPYFKRVFGGQEYYPPTKTKGLRNIPEDKMDETYEIVDLDGYEVLVPNLELLFLDKFLRKEGTPRESGYDCELLAERYDLDKDLVYQYLDEYYFNYRIDEEIKNQEKTKGLFVEKIIKHLNDDIEDNSEITLDDAVDSLNSWMENFKATNQNVIVCGINANSYTPLNPEDVLTDNSEIIGLTQEYIDKAMVAISSKGNSKIQDIKNDTLNELDNLFERSEQSKSDIGKDIKKKEIFSEQEIGKATINIPTNIKAEAQSIIKNDERILQQAEEQEYRNLNN